MKEIRKLLRVAIVFLAVMTVQPLAAAKKPQSVKPSSVDPGAKEALRRMSDYLSGLNSFKVHVQTTREVILSSAQELDSDHAFDLEVQRPDHLRADLRSAAGERQFFYDGESVTVYTPKLKYYAVFPAPSTIDGMFQEAAAKYGLEMPTADFICGDPYRALTKGVISGLYVGESQVDGTNCHHLAFRQKSVDWQIWIQDGPTPLPGKFVITDRAQRGAPRFTAVFSGWDVNPSLDASIFTFVPEQGARKIDIVNVRGLKSKQMPRGKYVPNR